VFVKSEERNLARQLRREQGLAVKEIARRVGVSVSSVSIWVRDVPLTPEQEAALDARNPVRNGQRLGTVNNSARCRALREEAQRHGRELARRGDPQFAGGCMLYWAEGSKNRNQLGFTNADPEMVDLFVHFLRRCYGVPRERIALTVNVHLGNGMPLEEIESWWLTRLDLPRSSLRRSVVNRPSRASQRKRRTLAYGTVRVVVSSTFIVQSIFGAIQTYAGLHRAEWLG
jgi:hypothetical protein